MRDGQVSCECCVLFEFPLVIGEEGPCGCDNPQLRCFGTALPAPQPLNGDPETHAPSNRQARVQGPIQGEGGVVVGWSSLVENRTVVILSGNIGGGALIKAYRSDFSPQPAPSEAPEFEVIPQEGLFDCGVCTKPRNAKCSFFYSWVMYPNMVYEIQLLSYHYLEAAGGPQVCNPAFRGTLAGGGFPAP